MFHIFNMSFMDELMWASDSLLVARLSENSVSRCMGRLVGKVYVGLSGLYVSLQYTCILS